MKRSLAPPRRDKPAGTGLHMALNDKRIPPKVSEGRGTSKDKPLLAQVQVESNDKIISQKFQERYRNKNLNALPTPLLVTLSTLTTLDISYNQLSDSQIQLIMNSCTKLSTLCTDGNITCLIPASIGKLKLLVNFRHDWIKLGNQMYEPQKRLEKIKQMAKKPNLVTKVNRVVGIDFVGYCQSILDIPLDSILADSINKSDSSPYAKQNMLKHIDEAIKNKTKDKKKLVTINQAEEKSIFPGCFGMYGNQERKKEQRWKELPYRKEGSQKDGQSQAQTEAVSVNIKIQDIRDLTEKNIKNQKIREQISPYMLAGNPLHELFSVFDTSPHGPAEIDGLLLRGYNPNIYDSNGVSPYHICVIYKQKKGLQYLLHISSNNPGFFDLQMPSTKDGRNILHYSVFAKNYQFTKMLIEFGMPVDKRDSTGARILHLVDQNYEFLILLRKLLKRKTSVARNSTILSIPQIAHQNKRSYVKHPQRQREQSRFRITYSKNDKLLQMFEAATGVPSLKK